MTNAFSYIFSILILFIFADRVHAGKAKSSILKTDSWIIFDCKKEGVKSDWLEASTSYPRTGFILNIEYNREEEKFYNLSDAGEKFGFDELANILVDNILSHNLRYCLLFNIEEQNVPLFNREIISIEEKIQQKPTSGMGTIQDILSTGSIHFFSFKKYNNLHKAVHYFYNYFEVHDIADKHQMQESTTVSPQASMLYGMYIDIKDDKEFGKSITDKRHDLQNKYLQNWKSSGLQPVFIVSDGIIKNFNGFSEIAKMPEYTHACYGEVTLNSKPMTHVYWLGDEISKSYGQFNFPVSECKVLKPYRCGYTFTPKVITAYAKDEQKAFRFYATPLKLTDQLQLKLLFNDNILKNQNNKLCEITVDRDRGRVLKVNADGCLNLETSEHYNIKDNSFTASFWFKFADNSKGRTCILGTSTSNFREGLHIVIRDDKPYFGFFINDISSQYVLRDDRWHHFAFSYDKTIYEKRIYIDGQLTDVSGDSPSFIGSDTLFIGKCLGKVTKRSFYLDNLILWSRALSETEINSLQSDDTLMVSIQQKRNSSYLTGICVGLIMLIVISLLLHLKFQKPKLKTKRRATVKERHKNSIFLYGNFTIYDNQSNNIVPNMQPLNKEIFMLLLVAWLKDSKGVSSAQLTSEFWEHLPPAKARNNRNAALARLRKNIEDVNGLSIEYHEGNHFLNISESFYIDAIEAEKLANETLSSNIIGFFGLIKKGIFLYDIDYEWIDDFKEEKNREVIQILFSGIQNCDDDHLSEAICQHILKMDDLHEESIIHLLKIYKNQGKLGHMNKLFNDFKNTYRKVYNEEIEDNLEKFIGEYL